jgi:purine-binding chemotaxis protein CheW
MKHKTRIGISPKTEETALRSVIFAVHDRWFALPVGTVLKVSLAPPINNSLSSGLGTVDLGNETVTVINLEEKFAPNRGYSFTHRYLILTQRNNGEKCGLITESPPSMVEIPLNTIRPLPASYRQQGEFSFVSHLAVLPKVGEAETIDVFLLGVRELFPENQNGLQRGLQKKDFTASYSSPQQFMRFSVAEKVQASLPVECVVKVIPFTEQALSPTHTDPNGILGEYHWQQKPIKLLDLNQLIGYPSLLESEYRTKTLTVLIIRLGDNYGGILVKAVRQLEWYDHQELHSLPNHSIFKGKFDQETFLLDLDAIAPLLYPK